MVSSHADTLLRNAVLASGLVTVEQLDYCLRVGRHRQSQKGIASDATVPDELLAEILVEQSLLTVYQANQLSQGKTKLNLGPYVVTDWIGQGGMGQVYKAVHRVMGRECAVKVLRNATSESIKSFAHEIRVQAKLDCPYLVRAFDAGQDGRVHFLVTEFVPGRDLRSLVKSQGPLPMQQAAKIVMQAALGLEYAHNEGMVHRDVKPGNILVTPEGQAKVSDVGLAGFASDLINDPRAGKIVGTTDYLSPEQIRTPLDIKPASDIYSLGCTLYYAVCGKVPFPGGDTESKLRRHLYEYPLHPRQFVPEISEDFADIIVDMMEKDVKKRIANAGEVASRLEPWASETGQLGAVALARANWSPPPPPKHFPGEPSNVNADSGTKGDASQTVVDQERGQQAEYADNLSHSDSAESGPTQSAVPPPPPLEVADSVGLSDSLGPPIEVPPASANKLSTGMLIALTMAIVVPPSLLIGAIIGYLVRGS